MGEHLDLVAKLLVFKVFFKSLLKISINEGSKPWDIEIVFYSIVNRSIMIGGLIEMWRYQTVTAKDPPENLPVMS